MHEEAFEIGWDEYVLETVYFDNAIQKKRLEDSFGGYDVELLIKK